jgi:hypothetical protein
MIYVCDAVMGSGKTEAAIHYIRSHPEKKFLYITPYLDEAQRIVKSCPEAHFAVPTASKGQSKGQHCEELLADGQNIASTHQLFLGYSQTMFDLLVAQSYVLIIDECLESLVGVRLSASDRRLLEASGYLQSGDLGLELGEHVDYTSGRMSDIIRQLQHGQLIDASTTEGKHFHCAWVFPVALLKVLPEIIVLTYLFESQDFCYGLQIHQVSYQQIGVHKTKDGVYEFTKGPSPVPNHVAGIKEKVHIVHLPKASPYTARKLRLRNNAFSAQWYRNPANAAIAKGMVKSYYKNHPLGEDHPVDKRMWTTFMSFQRDVYSQRAPFKAFLPCTQKSSNAYRNRDALCYAVNLYMNPFKKRWLQEHGATVLEDQWALSIMLQWVWRSAIRDGKDIWLYIPSRRMEKLFTDWLDSLA